MYLIQHRGTGWYWTGKDFCSDSTKAKKYRKWETAQSACQRVEVKRGSRCWYGTPEELAQPVTNSQRG